MRHYIFTEPSYLQVGTRLKKGEKESGMPLGSRETTQSKSWPSSGLPLSLLPSRMKPALKLSGMK